VQKSFQTTLASAAIVNGGAGGSAGMNKIFETQQESIGAFCRKHNIRRLSLFGSRLSGDAGQESDIDLIVEFDPGAGPHRNCHDGARIVWYPWWAAR
jgi:hypothetical protein